MFKSSSDFQSHLEQKPRFLPAHFKGSMGPSPYLQYDLTRDHSPLHLLGATPATLTSPTLRNSHLLTPQQETFSRVHTSPINGLQ